MPEMPVERQTVINKPRGEQFRSAEAEPRQSGSRSLRAGGEFLKALTADLRAVASRVSLLLAAKHRRSQPPPGRIPSGSGIGRVIWRVSMVFLGVVLLCSGALSAAMLWVIFGSPLEPGHSDPGGPGLRAEATNDTSPSGKGVVNAAEPPRPEAGPMAEATIPPAPPSASAAGQQKPTEETKAEAQAGSNQPQPAQTAAQPTPSQPQPAQTAMQPTPGQHQPAQTATQPTSSQPQPVQTATQPVPTPPQPVQTAAQSGSNQPQTETPDRAAGAAQLQASGTDQRAGTQCSVNLCAATYKSFDAADCTYQPYGGGPRSICELGAQSAAVRPQSSAVQPTAKSAEPDGAGPQCSRTLCAATYRSFNAADCTYQPQGGGQRAICKLSKGPADTPPQMLRAATDSSGSTPEANDIPVAGMMQEVAEPASPEEAGAQCNRSRCAAMYQSFHAADCTYQPEGGGPRRICEP
jgi:hypothetical protein